MNVWLMMVIFVLSFEVAGNAILHGKEKTGKWNVWAALFTTSLLLFLIYQAMKVGL